MACRAPRRAPSSAPAPTARREARRRHPARQACSRSRAAANGRTGRDRFEKWTSWTSSCETLAESILSWRERLSGPARSQLATSLFAAQADLTRDFRNLVHPGRAIRIGQKCNRATALSALAGIERVVNDLA